MKTPNPAIDLKFAADRLGVIKSKIADLETEAEIFKGALILSGAEAVEGDKYRAAVSHCPGRVIVNWRALAEHLGATPALVEEFTETGVPYSTVRVSARKGV